MPPKINSPSNFQQWAELNGFAHCGVFIKSGNFMLMTHAYGIDAQSVFCSVSTEDFWNGSAKNGEWIFAKRNDNDFFAFVQFLGKDVRAKAESIAILKSDSHIFFSYDFAPLGKLPQKNKIEAALPDLLKKQKENIFEKPDAQKISGLVGKSRAKNKDALLFTIEIPLPQFFDAADSCDKAQLQEAAAVLQNTIFEQIFYITKKLFSWPDFVSAAAPDKINVAAIISNNVPSKNLQKILAGEYESILGSDSRKTKISEKGYCTQSEKILEHLLRGCN